MFSVAEVNVRDRIKGSHIPALDGIRGISAFLVVFAHLGLLPRQFGALGVAIFFVLSGFLITWLMLGEADKTGAVSLRKFYARRTLRIFPAFYAFWIVSLLTAHLQHQPIYWPEAWASFVYGGDYFAALSPVYMAGTVATLFGVTWSLGVEEKFYLLWPWVFRNSQRVPQKLFRIALATVLVGWSYRIVVCLALHTPPDYLRYAFESRLDNIMIGALAAIMIRQDRFPRFITGVARWTAVPVLGLAVLAASAIFEEHTSRSYYYLFGMSFDSALIVCILVQLILLTNRPIWCYLETPVLRFFGKISYSLYLYHPLAILSVFYVMRRSHLRSQLPAALIVSVGVATLSYILVEKPFLNLKRRFAAK